MQSPESEFTVGDDRAGLGRHFEFLGGEFQHGGERGCLWNAKPETKNRKFD